MQITSNKYKKWDLVWVYWIFDNYIKEETDKLENQLNIYEEKAKQLQQKTQKSINKDENHLGMKDSIHEQNLKFFEKIKEQLNFGSSVIGLNIDLEKTINNYFNQIFKRKDRKYRPCLIFHRSKDNFWVMPLSTTNLNNFNKKFDIKLNDRSHVKCCSLQKIHISLIDRRIEINKKTNLSDENLRNKIIEKFKWFFLTK